MLSHPCGQVWLTPASLAVGRLRQEDCELEASFGNIVSLRPDSYSYGDTVKNKQKTNGHTNSAPSPDRGRLFCVIGKTTAAAGRVGSGGQTFVCCVNTYCMAGYTHWPGYHDFVWNHAGLGSESS